MKPLLRLALVFLLATLPAAAGRGDLFLDLSAGTFVQEQGRQSAMAGSMGFRFGADHWTEYSVGVDYGRFLAQDGRRQMELTGVGGAAFFSPYPGDLKPLLGARLGMTRLDGVWKPEVGLEAQALASVGSLFQAYASVNPGLWLDGRDGDIWVKLGLGLRLRLGY